MSKALVAAIIAIGSVVALPAQAATVASWTNLTFTGADDSNREIQSFSAQSGDLYIQLSLTASGTISANDFSSLWLDTASTGMHTNVPNIGLKADGSGSSDYMVRGSGTAGSFAPDLLTSGTTVTLWAHLYKSGVSTTYNTFDLWANPAAATWNDVLATAPEARSTLNSGLSAIGQAGFRIANLDAGDTVVVNSAAIYNAIPAVPEAETYAMLLAGLGLMATIARRRKNKLA